MDKQLTRDMAILVTARAARDAGFSPIQYVDRYAKGNRDDQDYLIEYLKLVEMVNETWKPKEVWDKDFYERNGEYILVWAE